MPAPGAQVSRESVGDGSLTGGLIRVDEDFLAIAAQPNSPGLGLDDAVLGRSLRMRDAEGRFEPGGVERADAFGQEDRVPVGQGGIGQVTGWASLRPSKVTSAGTHAASVSK